MSDLFKNLFNYVTVSDEYWLGPYDVRVPINVGAVRAQDGGNTLFQDGSCTEMGVMNPITEEEYKAIYTELNDDGYYYYVGLKPVSYISNIITKSFNPVIKNPTISPQFNEVFYKGTYFNPANKHYNENGIVQCDMCKTANLLACISYEKTDLCMNCIAKINNSIYK